MYRCVIAQLFSDLSKYCSAFLIRVKLVPHYVDTKMLRNSVKLYVQEQNVMAQETCVFKTLSICMSNVLCL